MPSKNKTSLLLTLKQDFSYLKFKVGKDFMWAPTESTVYYCNTEDDLSLLHETCHGILEHKNYHSDIQLVSLELEAWDKAKSLATTYGIEIDDNHIEDCMDTYRDWLHKRSLCPHCNLSGCQIDKNTYQCTFCHQSWKVTSARFCRPYRLKKLAKIN